MSVDPFFDQRTIITKEQVVAVERCRAAYGWQLHSELHVPAAHIRGAAYPVMVARSPQPVSHCSNGSLHIVVMRANVLSSDIRAEDLIAVVLAIENQARLSRL